LSELKTPEEMLALCGEIPFATKGRSMWPFVRDNPDAVRIGRIEKEIVKGDVILFRYQGRVLLHRVCGQDENGFITRGDNCIACETGIAEEDVIGILTGVTRKGSIRTPGGIGYKLYKALWCSNRFFVRLTHMAVSLRRAVKRRLKRSGKKR